MSYASDTFLKKTSSITNVVTELYQVRITLYLINSKYIPYLLYYKPCFYSFLKLFIASYNYGLSASFIEKMRFLVNYFNEINVYYFNF